MSVLRRGQATAFLPALALALAAAVAAAASPPPELKFIACPVYRDTDSGAKSGCWLATDPATGIRYDISAANTKPDWNRAVLVEARVSGEAPTACGAQPLAPVFVSVLQAACTRHELPAEGLPGQRFALPMRHIEPLDTGYAAPKPPFANRTFSLLFGFDRDFLSYQLDDWQLDQAVEYIRAAHPAQVVVTGFEQAVPQVVSGQALAERPGIARERAQKVALALQRLGVARAQIEVRAQAADADAPAELADGLQSPHGRRVEIAVMVPTR